MVTLDQEAIENKMKDVLSVNAAFGGLSDNNVCIFFHVLRNLQNTSQVK